MGLPEINIAFQSKAETAIKRSANGIVALILRDATKAILHHIRIQMRVKL